MFLTILNPEIVICIFSYYSEKNAKSRMWKVLYFQISPIFLIYLFIFLFIYFFIYLFFFFFGGGRGGN